MPAVTSDQRSCPNSGLTGPEAEHPYFCKYDLNGIVLDDVRLCLSPLPASVFGHANKTLSVALVERCFDGKVGKKHIRPICFCQRLTLEDGKKKIVRWYGKACLLLMCK